MVARTARDEGGGHAGLRVDFPRDYVRISAQSARKDGFGNSCQISEQSGMKIGSSGECAL